MINMEATIEAEDAIADGDGGGGFSFSSCFTTPYIPGRYS